MPSEVWDEITYPDDSPRDVWWTVLRNTVFFLSRSIFTRGFNVTQHVQLKILETRNDLNVIMVWHCDITAMVPDTMTVDNVNSWTDVAHDFTQTGIDCGKRVMRNISNVGSRSSYGPYDWLELSNPKFVFSTYTTRVGCVCSTIPITNCIAELIHVTSKQYITPH